MNYATTKLNECGECGKWFERLYYYDTMCDECCMEQTAEEYDMDCATISSDYFEAYAYADYADDEFSKAIKEQFGKRYNRFDFPSSDYNDATLEAYNNKIYADRDKDAKLKIYRDMLKKEL